MLETTTQVLVFILMFIIGANLSNEDISQLKSQQRLIFLITLGQFIFLPAIAVSLIMLFKPSHTVAGGMLLVSLCPGGAVSNIYSFFAKGNVTLSITLTTVSSLLAIVILPLSLMLLFPVVLDVGAQVGWQLSWPIIKLVLMLLLAIFAGMLFKYKSQKLAQEILPKLERLSGISLFLLILGVFYGYYPQLSQQIYDLALLAILFTVATLFIAFLLAKFLTLPSRELIVVMAEYPARNLPLASLIAVTVFHEPSFLLFAAVFFVVQSPLMLLVTMYHRKVASRSETQ